MKIKIFLIFPNLEKIPLNIFKIYNLEQQIYKNFKKKKILTNLKLLKISLIKT